MKTLKFKGKIESISPSDQSAHKASMIGLRIESGTLMQFCKPVSFAKTLKRGDKLSIEVQNFSVKVTSIERKK